MAWWLNVLTDKPIKWDDIADYIRKEFKKDNIESNDYRCISVVNKFPDTFFINFDNSDKLDDSNFMFDKKRDVVPAKNIYSLDINYQSVKMARRAVKALLGAFPECWIYDDDFWWVGPGKAYINSKHQETCYKRKRLRLTVCKK